MLTLPELFHRDSIHPTWFWTREVVTGPFSPCELWDLVLVRTLSEASATGGDVRRTAYFTGILGEPADARQHHGGKPQAPALFGVLATLLAAARRVDDHPNFPGWARHVHGLQVSDTTSLGGFLNIQHIFKRDHIRRDALRGWLGDDYSLYMKAAEQYPGEN